MFDRDAAPIGHIAPLPRIDINARIVSEAQTALEQVHEECDRATRRIEGDRVWKWVKQTAEGTCMPISSPSSTDLLTDYGNTVCTDGWEAG